jgi:hypothetical protein
MLPVFTTLTTWLKARFLLLVIALVWGWLISTVWEFQLAITVLGFLPVQALKDFRYRFWIVQDNMVNVIASFIALGKAGNPDVTVSSKVGTLAELGSRTSASMAVVINLLFWIGIQQKNHCAESIERDEEHYL